MKLIKIVLFLTIVLFAFMGDASAKSKTRFYDFSDQMINGEIKKPSTIYIDTRTRAKFAKLLSLKRSFIQVLLLTGKEPALK
tara:strand:- start:377 stop:622 length:246 start_codon:yes stop_codon:yes gene_type:complete